MKFFQFIIVIIPLLFSVSLSAEQVPAYSGDEASKYEMQKMEEQEEMQERQEMEDFADEPDLDSFGNDKYNLNYDPDAYDEPDYRPWEESYRKGVN